MPRPDRKSGVSEEIAARPSPRCRLCGGAGTLLYDGLQDALFGAPGSWGIRGCQDAACGLLWLDPAPLPSELHKAYRSYYTHSGAGTFAAGQRSWLRARIEGLYGHLVHYSGLLAARQRFLLRHLERVPPGKLLEIGCGDGAFLALARDRGWRVTGVDSDPLAAQAALERQGIEIRVGLFEECGFAPDSFDFVVTNHVIEHVLDPLHFIARCARVLRCGGELLMVTPNSGGLGHAYFGSNWRGLEPPRHLQIFSPRSLRNAVGHAGMELVSLGTSSVNAEAIFRGSRSISAKRRGGDGAAPLGELFSSWFYQYYALARNLRLPEAGEEIVALCRKTAQGPGVLP